MGPCPRCRSPYVDTPSFTWWGGALGPKLFNHAICRSCKLGFNSKTGKSNTTAIVLYQVIAAVIVLGCLLLYYLL